MFENISVYAGTRAIEIIRDEGLNLSRVKVLAGASGAAKFLVLTGIDRALIYLLKDRSTPLYLIGTSIGAFRMAVYCQPNPLDALEILESRYIAQQYNTRPSRKDVSDESWRIIDAYIDDNDIEQIISHPHMKINFLSSRCKALAKSENIAFQGLGFAIAAVANMISRSLLGCFFERALFHAPDKKPPFADMNLFPISTYPLTRSNFKDALLSSGSIPLAMEGVSNIVGAPGVFRDGGILDYHLDIPFLPEGNGLVLYPHFYGHITPGWFDKSLNRRPDAKNMENVVIVAPSESFVKGLPFGRIPDREDFRTFFQNDRERMAFWNKVVDKNRKMGDEFTEAVESGRIMEIVRPI